MHRFTITLPLFSAALSLAGCGLADYHEGSAAVKNLFQDYPGTIRRHRAMSAARYGNPGVHYDPETAIRRWEGESYAPAADAPGLMPKMPVGNQEIKERRAAEKAFRYGNTFKEAPVGVPPPRSEVSPPHTHPKTPLSVEDRLIPPGKALDSMLSGER